jgi:hypothetical protein
LYNIYVMVMEHMPIQDESAGSAPELTLPPRAVSVVDMGTDNFLGAATLGSLPVETALSAAAVRPAIIDAVENQLGPTAVLGENHRILPSDGLVNGIVEDARALAVSVAGNNEQTVPATDIFAYDPYLGGIAPQEIGDVDGTEAVDKSEPQLVEAVVSGNEYQAEYTGETGDVPEGIVALGELAAIGEVTVTPVGHEQQSSGDLTAAEQSDVVADAAPAELPGFRRVSVNELGALAIEQSATDFQRAAEFGATALSDSAELTPIMTEATTATAIGGIVLAAEFTDEHDDLDAELAAALEQPELTGDRTTFALVA